MKQEINLLLDEIEEATSADPAFSVKQVVEAILFSTNEPLSLSRIKNLLEESHPVAIPALRQIVERLQEEYRREGRAFQIEELPQGYLLRVLPSYHRFLERLHPHRRANSLSQAALEVLAIIAYRQPITRAGIEAIRGIDSAGIVSQLLERELITPAGKLEAPGRPMLYKTSSKFLIHFGLRSVEELSK